MHRVKSCFKEEEFNAANFSSAKTLEGLWPSLCDTFVDYKFPL